jgi:hypothetical protein
MGIGNGLLFTPTCIHDSNAWAVRLAHSALPSNNTVNGSRPKSGGSYRTLSLLAFRLPRSHVHSGPAKDSLKLLQLRLQEVETCLLKVLSVIPDDELTTALAKSTADFAASENLGESPCPMDTTSAVRSWQRVRTTDSTDQEKDLECLPDPTDCDGVSPNYHVDTTCATEDTDPAWQIASAPLEQGHTTNHTSQIPPQSLPSGHGKIVRAGGEEARLSHSNNPLVTHMALADCSSMETHDIQQQLIQSTVDQHSPYVSDLPNLARLSQQPAQPGGTGFPEHLFW